MLVLLLLCIAHITISEGRTHKQHVINLTDVDDIDSHQDSDDSINKQDSSQGSSTVTKNEPVAGVRGNKDDIKISLNDNATELIKELTNAVEKVNANLAIQNKSLKRARKHGRNSYHDSFDMIPPLARHKRSIKNASEANANSIDTFKINVPDNEPEVKKLNKTNEESEDSDWLVNSNETNANLTEITNSRRTFNSDMQIANVLRSRLLSYVHDNINDTMYKIDSLKNVKNSYGTDNAFNIGYIIANIDLIDINMKKLREGIEKNHHVWAESHILDVYDKVKYTNDVITNLINALKTVFNHQPNVNEYVYVK